jgi:hypothetical protein
MKARAKFNIKTSEGYRIRKNDIVSFVTFKDIKTGQDLAKINLPEGKMFLTMYSIVKNRFEILEA